MTTIKMLKQIRILAIIIICILTKTLYGKSLNVLQDKENEQTNERVKRGYSHYGANDFGSSVQVSSGVLQYSGGDDHSISSDAGLNIAHDGSSDLSAISVGHDSGSHYEPSATNADVWSTSGLSPGYEVWLEPTNDYHGSSALESSSRDTSSSSAIHPGSDHIANTVFSDDSTHSANFQLHSSQLHTNIASGNIGSSIHDHGDALSISDNIDFNNIADIKTKHYAKSYGK